MAGGRVRMVRIVNRTTKPLDCMFDGVPDVVPPGYRAEIVSVPKLGKDKKPIMDGDKPVMVDEERIVPAGDNGEPQWYYVEYAAAEAYIRQHPIMGTSDPTSISARDTDYLLGVLDWDDEVSHVEQSDAVELIDRSLLGDDRQNIKILRVSGGRREVASKSVIHDRKVKANKRRALGMGQAASDNPFGIKLRA